MDTKIIVALAVATLVACDDSAPAPTAVPVPTPAPARAPLANPTAPAGPKGSLKGTIPYTGKIAPPADVQHNFDPYCNRIKLKEEDLVVNPNHTLKNVFVHLIGAPAAPPPTQAATIVQSKCLYEPRVQGLVVGQTLSIRNGDPVLHNVHGFAGASSLFNRAQVPGAPSGNIDEKYSQPDKLLKFKCDVHPWMSAYVWVEANGLFAVSDASGNFEIKDIPEGKYEVEAWHETLGSKRTSITIVAGNASEIKIDFTGREGFGKI